MSVVYETEPYAHTQPRSPIGMSEEIMCDEKSPRSLTGDFSIDQQESCGFTPSDRHIRIAGALINYTYLQPDNPTDETPIGILNGFCAIKDSYKALAEEIASNGRPVFFSQPPRHQNPWNALQPGNLKNPLRIHSQANWGITKDVLARTDVGMIDLACNSMGALVGTEMTLHHPRSVRTILYIGGAGLDGGHQTTDMIRQTREVVRHARNVEREELMSHLPKRAPLDFALHVLGNPVRTAAEGYFAASKHIEKHLEAVQDHGIPMGTLLFENDQYFSPEETIKRTGKFFRYIEIIPGATHLYPHTHPEEHAGQVVNASQALNTYTTAA